MRYSFWAYTIFGIVLSPLFCVGIFLAILYLSGFQCFEFMGRQAVEFFYEIFCGAEG